MIDARPLRHLRHFLLFVLTVFAAVVAAGDAPRELDQAEKLLAADPPQPREALALIEKVLRHGRPSGRALLARSTARFMLGEHDDATVDLHRALELDPSLRQGWLNLAAVELAMERYDTAHQALTRAFELDPAADDNDLNLGTVLLFLNRADEADAHLARYLERHADDAEAFFQVAGNYALAGDVDRVVQLLGRAFTLDERLRMRARRDRRFSFFHDADFRRLMATDFYRPGDDAHHLAAAFSVRYDRHDRVLIDAVLDALRQHRVPYEPEIEATDHWTVIRGELRVKIANQPDGTGLIDLTAPAASLGAGDFQRKSQAILRTVHELLERRLAER